VNKSETGERMKIRVMNVNKKDLLKDMEKASEFDQSAMFKKVYEEEFGMFGGASYGALIGDYEFGNHPQDIALLEKMSQVAAAAHAPFISAADPACSTWTVLPTWAIPATCPRFFKAWNTPNGGHSGIRKTPDMYRCACRTS
jgi:type VI secretion system ImpC/EvpB family protein